MRAESQGRPMRRGISRPGKVWIVGAGPGDPELLTVRARKVLRASDIVFHDRLVDPRVLDALPARIARVEVGKEPGGRKVAEEEIIARLVRASREGLSIVRLKGGDPCVFGRGGEEAHALARLGIPFEIVPGVSAATAAPELAGIPLTYRGVARSFAVVTARSEAGSIPRPLPRADTLVVLMAVEVIEEVSAALLGDGWSGETPCALVERASLPGSRVVIGTIGSIAQEARAMEIHPPAALVVGPTVLLRFTANGGERAAGGNAACAALPADEPAQTEAPVFASDDWGGAP